MDPQACLQRIIDCVAAFQRLALRKNNPAELHPLATEYSELKQEWAAAFNDLGEWLRGGGFCPTATGPIFGMAPQNTTSFRSCSSRPIRSIDPHPITFLVGTGPGPCGYAIHTVEVNDLTCRAWVMDQYSTSGDGRVINQWFFNTGTANEKQNPTDEKGPTLAAEVHRPL